MNKELYEELKNTDITSISDYIYQALRRDVDGEHYGAYEVALMFLALERRRAQGQELRRKIEAIFESPGVKKHLLKLLDIRGELIEDIAKKFDESTLKAGILFSDLRKNAQSTFNSTPPCLSKLAMNLLSLEKEDILIDLGSGVGGFLIKAALNYQCKAQYGVEINRDNIIISSIKSHIAEKEIKFMEGNIISQDFSSLGGTKIFSDFPFGVNIPDMEKDFTCNPKLNPLFRYAKRTLTSDWVFILAAYFAMDPRGKCVCIMSKSATWNQADEEIRKMMVEKQVIEGLIALPENLLLGASIPISILVLSRENQKIKMVDATEIFTEEKNHNTLEDKDIEKILEAYYKENDHSKLVDIRQIRENNYVLNPARYLDPYYDIKDGLSMEEIAPSIRRGALISSSELEALVTYDYSNFSYLSLQNIKDGVIDSLLPRLSAVDKKYEKFFIEKESLIVSTHPPFKIARASFEEGEKVLACGNYYVIEIDKNIINPIFVEAFLQSEAGLAQLAKLSKGSATPGISREDLKRVKIPRISKEAQEALVREYKSLNEQLIELEGEIQGIRYRKSRLHEWVI